MSATTSLHEHNNVTESVPNVSRTFTTSNYKRIYDRQTELSFHHRLLVAVHDMVALYLTRVNPTFDTQDVQTDINEFMAKIQDDVFQNIESLKNDVNAVASLLWTSGKRDAIVHDVDLCGVMNDVIRDDVARLIEVATTIFRSINMWWVHHNASGDSTSYPLNGETWRGSLSGISSNDFS